jgi:hypothetical protein
MPYNYKGYDKMNKKWIYGEREIIVNPKTLSKRYFIVNETTRIEFEKEMMCKITPLTAGPNREPIYDKDIIVINFQDSSPAAFKVIRGEAELHLETEDVTIYGLHLEGFDGKDYIFSDKITKNPDMVEIIGNILNVS